MTSVHVTISGRVQGVGFRYWAAGEADRLGVGGWIRNRRDGRVEAMVCGTESAVNAMLDALKCGPPHARVDTIIELARGDDALKTFEVWRTV
jgi:acylphosphatase